MAQLSWLWWIVACVLLVAELFTGTFYLLMLAVGFAAGGLALLGGVAPGLQFVIAAVVAVVALSALTAWRRAAERRDLRSSAAARADADTNGDAAGSARDGSARARLDKLGEIDASDHAAVDNLDVGQRVQVDAWDGGSARIRYRGSNWNVELAGTRGAASIGAAPPAGWYRIVAVRGITLIVQPAAGEVGGSASGIR
ncbi:MAG: NfeD family protein [Janthinobacterium lividum]